MTGLSGESPWRLSHRFHRAALGLADRHYNRQKPGTSQFVPPGRCLVLVIPGAAVWVTSWPFAEYVKHAWAGAWVCSAFRNERRDLYLSSELVREAVAVTRWFFGCRPMLNGMVTFVDADKTRRKRDPGRCFIKAGFERCGMTKGGLHALRMRGINMPRPTQPLNAQITLSEAW